MYSSTPTNLQYRHVEQLLRQTVAKRTLFIQRIARATTRRDTPLFSGSGSVCSGLVVCEVLQAGVLATPVETARPVSDWVHRRNNRALAIFPVSRLFPR